ncbi:MAG: hypothetical protein ABIS47_11825 [Acidimicrobiales bacterium]
MGASTAAVPLLVVGYPVAIVVIARWVPVVREQRTTWFAAHAAGVTAVIIGWALRRPVATVPNIIWLVASIVWYRLGRPRSPGGPGPGS